MSNAIYLNAIISKSKNVFLFFFLFSISKIYIKFGILRKRRWASEAISFLNYRLQKLGFLKSLKRPVSEHLWTANMLKDQKHCLNLNGSVFVYVFWSLWKKISSKNSVSVKSKILRMFVSILTPDDMYSLSVKASV